MGLNFNSLAIDVQQIANYPKKILVQLGEYFLLRKKPFPAIHYFENSEKTLAVDAGGVGRDFLSRLMEEVFNPNLPAGRSLSLDTQKTPIVDDYQDTAIAYQTLGIIMSICYRGSHVPSSGFQTGDLLSEEVYRRLLCMPGESLKQLYDEQLVKVYQNYMGFPAAVTDAINYPEKGVVLNDKELEYLRVIVDFIDEDSSMFISQDYLKDPGNRYELRQAICNEVLQSKQIQALNCIAQGIRFYIGEAAWADFRKEAPSELHDKIEGTLNHETLMRKIVWRKEDSVSEEDMLKTYLFVMNWIARSDLQKMQQLVRAVSGNNTLSQNPLLFQVARLGPNIFPSSHTCSYALELSCDYVDQTDFDAKLERFLAEALAGSGFQTR